jgi:hypothetical protein
MPSLAKVSLFQLSRKSPRVTEDTRPEQIGSVDFCRIFCHGKMRNGEMRNQACGFSGWFCSRRRLMRFLESFVKYFHVFHPLDFLAERGLQSH